MRHAASESGERAMDYAAVSPSQTQALEIVSVVVGGISIVLTTIAVVWFLRMKRGFRHEYACILSISMTFWLANGNSLIIMLITSDLLKTLWLVIPPSIELSGHEVDSNSTLCQISGFFLALGIEACDMTVILIALHTLLYIFRRDNGLYRYRTLVSGAFVCVPSLLASLAFVSKPAFTKTVPFCYLPPKHSWTSKGLSWYPRYVVFGSIVLAYTCTYIYARCAINKYSNQQEESQPSDTDTFKLRRQQNGRTVPPTPPITYHGLIPSTPPCEDAPRPEERYLQALSETFRRARHVPSQKPAIGGVDVGNGESYHSKPTSLTTHGARASLPSGTVVVTADEGNESVVPSWESTGDEATSRAHTATTLAGIEVSLLQQPNAAASEQGARHSLLSMFHMGSCVNDSPRITLSPAILSTTGVLGSRNKIRRQLGQLFIYPLVYMLGWTLPFASHVTATREGKSSFGLVMASQISLCSQGWVDALVFLVLEKPWLHQGEARGRHHSLPWPSYQAYTGQKSRAGRTKDEMVVEGRIARQRRDDELAERRIQQHAHGERREWWDLDFGAIDASTYPNTHHS